MSESQEYFGARLERALAETGKTQAWVSQKTGIAESTISRWFPPNESTPQPRTIEAVANALGVRKEWLHGGEGAMLSHTVEEAAQDVLTSLDITRSAGGLDVEKLTLEEIRIRVQQFPFSDRDRREDYKRQIMTRLDEYDSWCEKNYAPTRKALKAHGRIKYTQNQEQK